MRQRHGFRFASPFVAAGFPGSLYRDPARGRVAGVCAGLAQYFQIRVKVLRIGMIMAMVFGFFVPILILYAAMALLLPPRPEGAAENLRADAAADRPGLNLEAIPALHRKLRSLDHRVAEIERRVLADELTLRRKFDDLGL